MKLPSFLPRPVQHDRAAPTVEAIDLTVRYPGHVALDHVSFRLQQGERWAVVGPNGAGKSTLLKAIVGVIPASEGEVRVAGHRPGGHICVAYVPQRSLVDWSFPVTAADVVMMGRAAKIGWLRGPGQRDHALVEHCLRLVGLEHLADRQIGELSGGQQQRMFLARAVAQEAEVVLMDEPMSGLDMPSREAIFGILDALRSQKVTVVVATHDLDEAEKRFDGVMLLNRRLVGMGSSTEVFTEELLRQAYGGQLRLLSDHTASMVINNACDGGEQ